MKILFLIASLFILLLISCENNNTDQEPNPDKDTSSTTKPDPNIFFTIGLSQYYKYSDLELYDSSTHILYFKTTHPEFDKYATSTFTFIINTDTIYKGDFWPSIRSDLPTRPYIFTWPFWLQSFALWIENRDNNPDPRNSPSIIQAFKSQNLLHSGLQVTINKIEIATSKVDFTFSITNKDNTPLLILDPAKVGLKIFHYFTNGLVFRKSPNSAPFYVKIPSQSPPASPGFFDLLSIINSDETKTFIISYPLDNPIEDGEYRVSFTYPGLMQVSKEQLFQSNNRIWLGSIKVTETVTVIK